MAHLTRVFVAATEPCTPVSGVWACGTRSLTVAARQARTLIIGLLVLGFASALVAQPVPLRGPVSGFVHLAGPGTLQPVLGVAGSAYLGKPLLDLVDFASVVTGRGFVVIDGRSMFVTGLADLRPVQHVLPDLIEGVGLVGWNQEGTVAVLYSSSRHALQRARFRDDVVQLDPFVDLASLGCDVTRLAVDSDGERIAVGCPDSLHLVRANQQPLQLLAAEKPGAFVFGGDGLLYAFDRKKNQILEFHDDALFGSFFADEGADLVGLALAKNGQLLLAADRANRRLRGYDMGRLETCPTLVLDLPLDFAPAMLQPFSESLYLLLPAGTAGGSLQVLDTTGDPAVYFVPAGIQDNL